MLLAHLNFYLFMKRCCCWELHLYLTSTQLSKPSVLSSPEGAAGGIGKMSHSRLYYSLHGELSNLSCPFKVFTQQLCWLLLKSSRNLIPPILWTKVASWEHIYSNRGDMILESLCMLSETDSLLLPCLTVFGDLAQNTLFIKLFVCVC